MWEADMENNDRELSSEELLDFIREVSNSKTVSDIQSSLGNLLKNEKEDIQSVEVKEDTASIDDTSFKGASIYDADDLPLVRADYEDMKEKNKQLDNNTSFEDEEIKEEATAPVLEKRLPNPWEGIRTVTPGDNN